jgi:hypothetical protein
MRFKNRATVPGPTMGIASLRGSYGRLIFRQLNLPIAGTTAGAPQLALAHQDLKFVVLDSNAMTQTNETVLWNETLTNPRIN